MPTFLLLVLLALGLHGPSPGQPPRIASAPTTTDERVDALVERIDGLSGWKKSRAIEDLAGLGSREALEALLRIIDDLKNDEVRGRAMKTLLGFREKEGLESRAVRYLAEQCGSGKAPVRRSAAEALKGFGAAAEPELRGLSRRSRDEVVRAHAVGGLRGVLVAAGDPASLELLLENAEPGRSGTEEELLTALGAFSGEDCTELLLAALRRSVGSPALRVLVCRAISGRPGELAEKALVAALRDEAWEVRLEAVKGLGGRGSESPASRLERLYSDPSEPVRREAVIQSLRLEQDRGERLARLEVLAGDRDPGLRQGAAVVLGSDGGARALDLLEVLLDDPDHLVRREALRQVGSLHRKEVLPLLLERLPAARGRHRSDLLQVLRLLTGLDHGTSPARWSRWWQAEGDGFTLPPYEEALAAERSRSARRDEGGTSSSFFGLQVVSERVVFVMDVSGSMEQLSGGQRRIDAAKEQLVGALGRYPEEGRFNLIFFSTGADAWSDEAVRMNRKSREEALEFVVRQRPGGGTAIHTALELAFEDREIDTIYLLTDGVPSAGRVTDPGRIREEVRRWNAHRGVVVHGIAVGVESPLLRGLAADTGGEYTFVR